MSLRSVTITQSPPGLATMEQVCPYFKSQHRLSQTSLAHFRAPFAHSHKGFTCRWLHLPEATSPS
jgi:hypothetical protein